MLTYKDDFAWLSFLTQLVIPVVLGMCYTRQGMQIVVELQSVAGGIHYIACLFDWEPPKEEKWVSRLQIFYLIFVDDFGNSPFKAIRVQD